MLQQAFIGLGANLGEPESTLKEAVLRIADIPGVRFVQVSSLYKTCLLYTSPSPRDS